MALKYEFPSLKQLSILRVCQHWAEAESSPFRILDENFQHPLGSNSRSLDHPHCRPFVEKLSLPPVLKADVWEVLRALLQQVRSWTFPYWRDKLVFDPQGRLDEQKIIRNYYANAAPNTDLLVYACRNYLLPEMDMMIRKMVAPFLEGQTMSGPWHEVIRGRHVAFYTLELQPTTRDALKRLFPKKCRWAKFQVELHWLTVVLSSSTINLDAFKVRYNLLLPSERGGFAKDVVLLQKYPALGCRHVLDILLYLQEVEPLQKWSSYFEGRRPDGESHVFYFAAGLLQWPYTQFLAQMLRRPFQTLDEFEYRVMFNCLVQEMPQNPDCGTLHGSLLLEVWNDVPANVKRCLASAWRNSDYVLPTLRRKSPFVYRAISKEIGTFIGSENHPK